MLRVAPDRTSDARWSERNWAAMDGRKQDGAGAGYFEYRLAWPRDLRAEDVVGASFVAELGAKQLFGKDRSDKGRVQGDFMLGAGTHDPGLNPNAYPMTDGVTYPSAVRIVVNGVPLGSFDLPDDPADHRGLLSWHAQKRDGRLDEAGSYGTLVTATVNAQALRSAAAAGELRVRLEVDEALPAGLAVYGEASGRYPARPDAGAHARPLRAVRTSAAGTSRSAGAPRRPSRRRSAACRSSGTRQPRARPPSGRSYAAARRAACPRAPSGNRRWS